MFCYYTNRINLPALPFTTFSGLNSNPCNFRFFVGVEASISKTLSRSTIAASSAVPPSDSKSVARANDVVVIVRNSLLGATEAGNGSGRGGGEGSRDCGALCSL